jgi:hypothetical protein
MNNQKFFGTAAILALLSLGAQAQVTVSTVVSSGLDEPYNVVEDTNGNMFVSDSVNERIVRIDASTAVASVLAGVTGIPGSNDGTAAGITPALFNNPQGLLPVAIGGTNGLLVADSGNNLLRFVRFSDGYVTTLAGQNPVNQGSANEIGANASFNYPVGMDQDTNGNVYIADEYNNAIRVMNLNDPAFGITNLVFSDGTTLHHPSAVALATVVAGTNTEITATNSSTTVTQSGGTNYFLTAFTVSSTNYLVLGGQLVSTNLQTSSYSVTSPVTNTNELTNSFPLVATSLSTNYTPVMTNQLWVADSYNNSVKLITLATPTSGSLTTYIGGNSSHAFGAVDSAYGPSARFYNPSGLLWINGLGLLISDTRNSTIRLATNNPLYGLTNYAVTTYAGIPQTQGSANGEALSATFNQPIGLCSDPANAAYLVADLVNGGGQIRSMQFGTPRPTVPTGLSVNATYGSISVSWGVVDNATSYNVKRSISSGGPFATIGNTNTVPYVDSTPINGRVYYYVVSALNSAGESANSAVVSASTPIPMAGAPSIGTVSFPYYTEPYAYASVFTAVSPSVVLNNDVDILIDSPSGTQIFYTYTNTPITTNTIPLATPTTTNSVAQAGYEDGNQEQDVSQFIITTALGPVGPELTINALVTEPYYLNSPLTTVNFDFVAATPSISGDSPADFTISEITSNAVMYYTIDGSDPNPSNPSATKLSNTNASPGTLSLSLATPLLSNTVFSVRAYRDPTNYYAGGSSSYIANTYAPSSVATKTFYTNSPVNTISFGFGTGPGTPGYSQLVASPGQSFMAPVALQLVSPNISIYSMQFNVTATNAPGTTHPISPSATFSFSPLVWEPDPTDPQVYITIPTWGFVATNLTAYDNNPTNIFYNDVIGPGYFQNLQFTDQSKNLLGVGWLETYGQENLYNTKQQDLLTYCFFGYGNSSLTQPSVILGGYSFTIPANATTNDVYQIQLGLPSAASQYGPVDITAPLSTNAVQMAPGTLNALKNVTIGQIPYLVGDVYPAPWYNAGDFGSKTLNNEDVLLVFNAAVYSFNVPPSSTDLFDALDSCGNLGLPDGNGALTNGLSYTTAYPTTVYYSITNVTTVFDLNSTNVTTQVVPEQYTTTDKYESSFTAYSVDTYVDETVLPIVITVLTNAITMNISNQLNNLFNGNDTTINQIAFGDGVLDVCDVYVTYRRSLDPSLTWYLRYWSNGHRVAVATNTIVTNGIITYATSAAKTSSTVFGKAVTAKAAAVSATTSSTVDPSVIFTAGDVLGTAGTTVTVPINATIAGNYPLRVLMLNLNVTPLDGSPALTNALQFTPNPALGTPYLSDAKGNANYAAAWLDSTIDGISGTTTLGTLSITIPANAPTNAAYAVTFAHASASPNGIASFPKQTSTGLVTLYNATNSYYGDGIPDSWRLRWFGTIYNVLSESNACPSGDGIPNWKKYVAGVDPNVANDFPSVTSKSPVPTGATTAISWPSVLGKQYVIQRAPSLFGTAWTTLSTNTGTGDTLEFDDNSTANVKFYRVEILP